jgi:hypothetical protein
MEPATRIIATKLTARVRSARIRSGSSAWGERISMMTNATRRAMPPTMGPMVQKSVHP